MRSLRLLYRLTAYYLALSLLLLAAAAILPEARAFLPVGGVETLVAGPAGDAASSVRISAERVQSFGGSLLWLIAAVLGAVVASLPVSWTYMEIRSRDEYNQSLVETIVILPMVVTGIVVVVHNSLALAFSLAGIAAGVRFRHALKSPGDVLFILLAIGIGLSSGIGAVELAIVMSLAFNYCFLILWINDYGARPGTRRFMRSEVAQQEGGEAAASAGNETSAAPPGEPLGAGMARRDDAGPFA